MKVTPEVIRVPASSISSGVGIQCGSKGNQWNLGYLGKGQSVKTGTKPARIPAKCPPWHRRSSRRTPRSRLPLLAAVFPPWIRTVSSPIPRSPKRIFITPHSPFFSLSVTFVDHALKRLLLAAETPELFRFVTNASRFPFVNIRCDKS